MYFIITSSLMEIEIVFPEIQGASSCFRHKYELIRKVNLLNGVGQVIFGGLFALKYSEFECSIQWIYLLEDISNLINWKKGLDKACEKLS
jgi:hypothetical protein